MCFFHYNTKSVQAQKQLKNLFKLKLFEWKCIMKMKLNSFVCVCILGNIYRQKKYIVLWNNRNISFIWFYYSLFCSCCLLFLLLQFFVVLVRCRLYMQILKIFFIKSSCSNANNKGNSFFYYVSHNKFLKTFVVYRYLLVSCPFPSWVTRVDAFVVKFTMTVTLLLYTHLMNSLHFKFYCKNVNVK